MKILGMIGPWQLGLIVLVLILPFIALIDVLRNEFTGSNKVVWLIVVLILPILGALLYFLIGTKQKTKR